VPPQVVVWHRVWFVASHSAVLPPPQVPAAPLAPQPEQVRPVVRAFRPQLSVQEPASVAQPDPPEQVAAQHWLPPPTAQVVWEAEHEQALHTSPVPLQYFVQLTG
jgi:hypothetical protein